MARFFAGMRDLVILSGQIASRTVNVQDECSDAIFLSIQAPATMPETTVIQVSDDDSTWATLANDTGDVPGPAAGKAREYDSIAFRYFRLLANGAVAADRTLKLKKIWNAY